MDDLHYWSIGKLGARLRAGSVSAVEVTQHMLARIGRLDPQLNSYQTVMADHALAQAQAADDDLARGLDRGPLHGVPVAIKDCIYTANAATTVGSKVLGGTLPWRDATAVSRLNAAGAVMLGKLVLTEGTLVEHLPGRPAPVNPWNATLWTGVSSSGSGVATAAGLCFASLGTDTGGSIRMPSAANGLTGLKPTWGRVSLEGIYPMCQARDHVGPMARSAEDAALVLGAIAGADAADPLTIVAPVEDYAAAARGGVSGLRLGIDWAVIDEAAPGLRAALREAIEVLQSLGMRVVEVRYPSADAYLDVYAAETSASLALVHAQTFPSRAADYGVVLRKSIERAQSFTAVDLFKAEVEKARFKGALNAAMADIDVLLLPLFTQGTPLLEDFAKATDPAAIARQIGRYALPLNATGHPSLVAPCGVDGRHGPMALQLVGDQLADARVLRVAGAYQRATGWHVKRPPTAV